MTSVTKTFLIIIITNISTFPVEPLGPPPPPVREENSRDQRNMIFLCYPTITVKAPKETKSTIPN